MNEVEKRAYYDKNGDQDIWGEPDMSREKPSKRLGTMISVRFTLEEAALLRELADEEGLTLSAFLRMTSLRRVREVGNPFTTFSRNLFLEQSLYGFQVPTSMNAVLLGSAVRIDPAFVREESISN